MLYQTQDYGKDAQLERDFGIIPPHKRLSLALSKRDTGEISLLLQRTIRERLRELMDSGLCWRDSMIVLLMRGARVDALAKVTIHTVPSLVSEIKAWAAERDGGLDPLHTLAQRTTNLGWRS